MSAQAQQIRIMLELQDGMNTRVNADWHQQGYEWYRAIWVECAELMDHYGWKWWKKQSPDTDQVALELIDIWHFGLSILLQSGASLDEIIARIERELVIRTDEQDFRLDLEQFAAATLADKQFHIGLFARLMAGVSLSFDQLYRGYVGKNVLNFFRQDHGYKDGTYRKHWQDGREDNEHLVDAVKLLDASRADFKDALYLELKQRYIN
ncbi:dUTP diphosphatase [Cellvibrio japonicus]|uniref:dUTPase n=1 Tax=Cellvibrio japonicus (strain Ueda107) TaxID=498211 RepID=B3PHI5_CELJU|nr:dUTP diphosphatase [Cellvibrio japonicus]ACE84034.1 dUTPase [Cellvibrio japonicus Ueda107]QEI12463.1 dUTP diphosphatase [Cellvibrio japonicus]QEI16037.1 dUTP diphosphatase [Cellvibrio japonicus]QEI19615.1 dUTP diphosphatase [Cellvibrio japonicus]